MCLFFVFLIFVPVLAVFVLLGPYVYCKGNPGFGCYCMLLPVCALLAWLFPYTVVKILLALMLMPFLIGGWILKFGKKC